jgi:hypothetical protein
LSTSARRRIHAEAGRTGETVHTVVDLAQRPESSGAVRARAQVRRANLSTGARRRIHAEAGRTGGTIHGAVRLAQSAASARCHRRSAVRTSALSGIYECTKWPELLNTDTSLAAIRDAVNTGNGLLCTSQLLANHE